MVTMPKPWLPKPYFTMTDETIGNQEMKPFARLAKLREDLLQLCAQLTAGVRREFLKADTGDFRT